MPHSKVDAIPCWWSNAHWNDSSRFAAAATEPALSSNRRIEQGASDSQVWQLSRFQHLKIPPATRKGVQIFGDFIEGQAKINTNQQTSREVSQDQTWQLFKLPATRRGMQIFGDFVRMKPKMKPTFEQLFRRLPAEIRLEIFKYALCRVWDGEAPPLVQALRARQTMNYYFEAVDMFPKVNTYWLHDGNDRSFLGMGGYQISGLKHLALQME